MSNTQPILLNADVEIEKQHQNTKKMATPASWKPGQSGNPLGRPKKDWTWKDLFVDAAEEMKETKQGRMQVKRIIAKRLFHMAMQGNVQAIKEVIDRMDGKAIDKQEVDMNVKKVMVVIDD